MTVTRILFLARYRLPHALFSLQWDQYLQDIAHTVVATPMDKQELWPIFDKYGIDTSCMSYVNDAEIYQHYPQVNNWVFADDYRTYWLRQQAIKLSYVDRLPYDVMLLWDPDTFMIRPYRAFDARTGKITLMSLMNTTQGSYEGVFRAITGIDRTTPHCFVTEYMPVRKADWQALRSHLSGRWPGQHWLDAIIQAVPGIPTVPPWGNGNLIKWFSEYEFLGNWAVYQGNVDYFEQRRFEYDSLEKIAELDPTEYNAVCDAVPDLRLSMQFDWDRQEVQDWHVHRSALMGALNGG